MKTKFCKRLIVFVIVLISSLKTCWDVEFAFRTLVCLRWSKTSAQWHEISSSLDDINGLRGPEGLFDYNLINPFEMYAMRAYTVVDKDGTMTREQLEALVQPIADELNRELDGNPAQVFVGAYLPDHLRRVGMIFKPFNLWDDIKDFFKSDSEKQKFDMEKWENSTHRVWNVVIYKRARNPFLL